MNKKAILGSLLIGAFMLNAAEQASAAPVSQGSEADVGFVTGSTGPSPITPPVDPPVGPVVPDPGDDNDQVGNTGDLVMSIPKKIKFGNDNKINLLGDEFFALGQSFISTDPANTEKYYYPPHIVVKDVRGLEDGKWSLSVAMTGKFNDGGADANKVTLDGTTIEFKGAQLFNSQTQDATDPAERYKPGPGLSHKANLTMSAAQQVFMSADGSDDSSNAETTYIGDSRFVPSTATELFKGDKYKKVDGILLNVPAKDMRVIRAGENYTAQLTWVLSADSSQ